MNCTGKFLVSALLIHAANLKKVGDTQTGIVIPQTPPPANGNTTPQWTAGK